MLEHIVKCQVTSTEMSFSSTLREGQHQACLVKYMLLAWYGNRYRVLEYLVRPRKHLYDSWLRTSKAAAATILHLNKYNSKVCRSRDSGDATEHASGAVRGQV